PALPVLIRDPRAAHQAGLADIQRRNPLNDLVVVLRSGEHHRLLASWEDRRPQEPRAHLEKSNPRARSNTEQPVSWLPAPGLETTSTIKQWTASAGSSHPQFSAPNGRPCRESCGLEDAAHQLEFVVFM